MLACQNPAHFDTKPQNVRTKIFGPFQLTGDIGVVHDQGVQIAIPGMEHVGHTELVLVRKLGHARQHFGQLVARDGPIHAVIIRRQPPDRRERRLAAGPELQPLFFALADPHRDIAQRLSDLAHPFDQVVDLHRRPIKLHQQQRFHIQRIAHLHKRFGRLDRRAIHHLHAAGDNARANNIGDALAAGLARIEPDHQRPRRRRLRQDPHCHFGDHTQQAFGPGHQAEQIIAFRIHMLAAKAQNFAIGQHHLDTENVVGGQPVFQAVHAAGILRHIAANGAGDLAGGVGRIVEAIGFDRLGDAQIGHAGLHPGTAVFVIHFQHPVELTETKGDGISGGQRAPRKRGSGPPWHDFHGVVVAVPHHFADLLNGFRQHDDQRQLAIGCQPVRFIHRHSGRIRDHPFAGHHRVHRRENLIAAGQNISIRIGHLHEVTP